MPVRPNSILRSDLDILSRIKRHDPSAIGELYDRYGKTAYKIILRIVYPIILNTVCAINQDSIYGLTPAGKLLGTKIILLCV